MSTLSRTLLISSTEWACNVLQIKTNPISTRVVFVAFVMLYYVSCIRVCCKQMTAMKAMKAMKAMMKAMKFLFGSSLFIIVLVRRV